MTEQKNVALIKDIMAAFGRGDVDAIIDACADDITVFIPGPEVIPFAGHFKGKNAIREYFELIPRVIDLRSFSVHGYVAQGKKVVVNGHEVGVVRSTEKEFENNWVMVWTFEDGVVTDIFEYHDTAALVEAFRED
jgi:ketosteroid isomerase-like protein